MAATIAFDTETLYCTKTGLGVREQGTWKYCQDPRWDCYLISVSDGEQSWSGHPRDFNWNALDGAVLVSHNSIFDQTVYRRLVELGKAPKLNIPEWHCSANMSSYCSNRRSLKDAAKFLLGVELFKETRDYANGKTWEDIVREGKSDEMLAYARSDAQVCWQLFAKYGHLWPARERALSELTINQHHRGIQINVELLKQYIGIAQQMLIETEATLPWIKDGRAPTSSIGISLRCREVGISCPPVKSHYDDGEARFAEWENAYIKFHPWIANVSAWRSINKFLASLQTVLERTDENGIFYAGLKYFGAHTGRWSGEGGFNLQNLRKEPIYRDDNGLMIADEARLKEIRASKQLPGFVTAVLDIRKIFIPRPGMKMIVGDLSQIEARVLLWLAGDFDALAEIKAGKSVYQVHAEKTMGWTGGDLKKENPGLYALAKARVLGLGFGAGWKKFIVMAQTLAGLDIAKDDPGFVQAVNDRGEPCFASDGAPILIPGWGQTSKRIVKEYREQNSKIIGIWKSLDTDFKNSIGGDYEIELPSGRSLRYGQVKKECRIVKDDETGKICKEWKTTANIGGRRFPLYGGLLCENLTQATARDVFAEGVLNLHNTPGVNVLWTCHDEAICEADASANAKDIEYAMTKTPEWAEGLPLAADISEVPHYMK